MNIVRHLIDFTKGGEFLAKLTNYKLLKEDSAAHGFIILFSTLFFHLFCRRPALIEHVTIASCNIYLY